MLAGKHWCFNWLHVVFPMWFYGFPLMFLCFAYGFLLLSIVVHMVSEERNKERNAERKTEIKEGRKQPSGSRIRAHL